MNPLLCIDIHAYSESTKMGLYTLFVVPFTEFRVGEVVQVAPKARRRDLLPVKMIILRPWCKKVSEV